MLLFLVLVFFLGTFLVGHFRFLNGAEKKAKVIHFILMAVSFAVLLSYSLNYDLISPAKLIGDAINAVLGKSS